MADITQPWNPLGNAFDGNGTYGNDGDVLTGDGQGDLQYLPIPILKSVPTLLNFGQSLSSGNQTISVPNAGMFRINPWILIKSGTGSVTLSVTYTDGREGNVTTTLTIGNASGIGSHSLSPAMIVAVGDAVHPWSINVVVEGAVEYYLNGVVEQLAD